MARARLNLDAAAIARNGIRWYLGGYAGYGGLRMRARHLYPAYPAIRQTFFEHEVETFRRDGAIGGWEKWDDVVGRYADWKRKHFPGKSTLRLSGKLMRQMTGASGDHYERRRPTTFTIGSNYPVAGSSGQRSSWATDGITGGVLPHGHRWSLDADDEDIGGLHQEGGFFRLDGPGRVIEVGAREPIRLTDQFANDVTDHILDHVTRAGVIKHRRRGFRVLRRRS
jgi:phage gpG-like protein